MADTAFTDAHLTRDFFATALAHDLATSVTVSDVRLSPGSSVGENFCSDIYRAAVTYRPASSDGSVDTTVSLIVKAMPYTAARTPLLDDLEVYAKELRMYTDTLPRMSALLGGERLSARLLYAVRDPVQIIVFEDLCAAGFSMAERTAGIDEAHCELVLAKLGRFHGASVVLLEQDASALRHYQFGLFRAAASPTAGHNPVMEAVFHGGLRSVIEVMRTWPGYGGTVTKLERVAENFMTKIDHHCNRTTPAYRVLNHGDLWINNILFRYDHDGRPTDVCFIDYQMSFASSPGHDLNYFINTSPQNAVREQRRDHIIQLYQRSFQQTLQRLHSTQRTRLTADLLRSEIEAREFYGLVAAVGILPLVLMTRGGEHELTMNSITDESQSAAIQRAMYNNPSYVTAMRYIARRFDVQGVLDKVPDVVL